MNMNDWHTIEIALAAFGVAGLLYLVHVREAALRWLALHSWAAAEGMRHRKQCIQRVIDAQDIETRLVKGARE